MYTVKKKVKKRTEKRQLKALFLLKNKKSRIDSNERTLT